MSEQWMTVDQAAERLGKSRRTVYRWVTSGRLRSRVAEGGQRQVLLTPPIVEVPPPLPPEDAPYPSQPAGPGADRPVQDAARGLDFLADVRANVTRRVEALSAARDMRPLPGGLSAAELARARRRIGRQRAAMWAVIAVLAVCSVGAQWLSLQHLRQVERQLHQQRASAGVLTGELQGRQQANSVLAERNLDLHRQVARLQEEIGRLRTNTAVARTPWPQPPGEADLIELPEIPTP